MKRAEYEGMEEVIIEKRSATEEDRVLDWRFDAFESAGFNPVASLALASSGVDHHTAASLLANGCPHNTALRILL